MGNHQADGPDQKAADNKSKKRSPLRFLFKAAFAAVAVLIVGSAVVFYLAQSEPAYWKEHQRLLHESSPEQLEQLAEEVTEQLQHLATIGPDALERETKAVEKTLDGLTVLNISDDPTKQPNNSGIKPADIPINQDQTISLTNPQLAAVVQTRLDGWMADRGYVKPEEIKDPMIAVNRGDLVMAFLIQTDVFNQVVSGRFDLKIRKDGYAELTMERFLLGNLPVPANALGEHLRNYTDDDRAVEAGEWLEKLQYMEFKPVIELDHRRRARVQDYKLLEKGLELTVRVQDHKTYKAMNQSLAGVTVD